MGYGQTNGYAMLICQLLRSIKQLLAFIYAQAQEISQFFYFSQNSCLKAMLKAQTLDRTISRMKNKNSLSLQLLLKTERKLLIMCSDIGIPVHTTSIYKSIKQKSSTSQAEINSFFNRISSNQIVVDDGQCIQCCEKFKKNTSVLFGNYLRVPHVAIPARDFFQNDIALNNCCALLNSMGGYLVVGATYNKIQGFILDEQSSLKLEKSIQTIKSRVVPQFKLESRIVQIESNIATDKRHLLILKMKPLKKRQFYYIIASKVGYSINIGVSNLSGQPQNLVAKKLHPKYLYQKMLSKYKENKENNFAFQHNHLYPLTSNPLSKIYPLLPKIPQQEIVKPLIKYPFKKSKQFLNLLAVGSSKKIDVIQKFKSQLKAEKRIFQLHQPFAQNIIERGQNGRSIWVYEHDEKLPLIRELMKKYDKGRNINLLVASKQIQFQFLDRDPSLAQSFYQSILQLYPQQKNFKEYFFIDLKKNKPEISITFRSIQASAFAITWLQSVNIRAYFVKTQIKNVNKYS